MMPAYFANMAPVIVKDIFNKLAIPIDFGKKINGKEIFGKNKTFRGFIFAVVFGVIIAFLQFLLYRFDYFKMLSFIDYSNWLVLGILFGFGAIFGDLVKSFFKRRLNISPGQRFVPWDQLDFVVGALVFVSFILEISWGKVVAILLISFLGHIAVNHSAYSLGIRKEKW